MLNSKIKIIIGMGLFALVITGAFIAYNTLLSRIEAPNAIAENTEYSEEKTKAPDFSMVDINGNTLKLSDLKGKPVVLNFWASWCPPCKIEMPEFDKVWKEVGNDVHFVMLCLTDGLRETVKSGREYITQEGFSFPIYFDTGNEGGRAYGIRSIPSTIFIDSEGFILAAVQGAINETTLRKGIEIIF